MATVDLSTPEARRRNAPPGLRGKALETFIKTGKRGPEQAAEAAAARKAHSRRRRGERPTSDADAAIVRAAKKYAPRTATWPRQVERIRGALGKRKVLDAVGMNQRQLRAYAEGKPIGDADLSKLRALGKKTGDPYCSGRRLAAVLMALLEEKQK